MWSESNRLCIVSYVCAKGKEQRLKRRSVGSGDMIRHHIESKVVYCVICAKGKEQRLTRRRSVESGDEPQPCLNWNLSNIMTQKTFYFPSSLCPLIPSPETDRSS